ncbi:heme-binding protein [Roseovarius aestuarii]|uniref:Uncharacterized protein n=1 Tax=Roseovarius aestuarii TaxID=475083 RepID=A0A1X7BMS7_9RHOB|nr:heme-binding protein [Roseovarius aestuarii]SMC10901.1 hypothetical protein ROA7745_00709 [Roseovarius aestuarii]
MSDKRKHGGGERQFYSASLEMEQELGPLKNLPGTWRAKGTGWNMIALPFKDAPEGTAPYRILMNQYDETLSFAFVDDNVPNRGVLVDQRVATIDYQQQIAQIAADDFPVSGEAGGPGLPIHHEPGLFIWVKDHRTDGIDIARLASIPHGNSVLALGDARRHRGAPEIPPINALPLGRFEDLTTPGYDVFDDDYLDPYEHYINNPFFGTVPASVAGFPGFNPRDMTEILRFANQGVNIKRTTELVLDTKREGAGVQNMPFTEKEAEPVSMKSTFWIQELNERAHKSKYPKLRLQYAQVVMLNFFRPREDGFPGRAQWPHISIATLEKEDYPE